MQCSQVADLTNQRFMTSDWCRHLANWTKLTRRLFSGISAPLCENITSFTKLEVYKVYCRQRRTESHPQVTRKVDETWTWTWFLRYASSQTDKQTGRHTHAAGHIVRRSSLLVADILVVVSAVKTLQCRLTVGQCRLSMLVRFCMSPTEILVLFLWLLVTATERQTVIDKVN